MANGLKHQQELVKRILENELDSVKIFSQIVFQPLGSR